jgi:hypothetical protein
LVRVGRMAGTRVARVTHTAGLLGRTEVQAGPRLSVRRAERARRARARAPDSGKGCSGRVSRLPAPLFPPPRGLQALQRRAYAGLEVALEV